MHAGTADGIVALDATAMAAAIAVRALSCREVMEAHLARIEALNGMYNALVLLRPADALMADADATVARGDAPRPAHAVKDLAATKGLRTTFGSPLVADSVHTHDALFVERLRAAARSSSARPTCRSSASARKATIACSARPATPTTRR